MKSSWRGVSRGLLAVTVLTAVIALCPCFADTAQAMDDCCPPSGVSMTGSCCVRPSSQSRSDMPTLAQGFVSTLVVFGIVPRGAIAIDRLDLPAAFGRGPVARPILRI